MKYSFVMFVVFAVLVMISATVYAESKGEQIFKQKCSMCHVVNGKGGKIGPELTKVAAGMKDNDIKSQLENPKKQNPSSSMPAFKSLPKADMDALLGYLKTLK